MRYHISVDPNLGFSVIGASHCLLLSSMYGRPNLSISFLNDRYLFFEAACSFIFGSETILAGITLVSIVESGNATHHCTSIFVYRNPAWKGGRGIV